MYKIKAKLVGLAPLRHNRFLEADTESANKGKMTKEQQIEDAELRAYYDEEIGYYIPRNALRKCIINVGMRVKVGRRSAGKELAAIMFINQEKLAIGTHDKRIMSDIVRIPPRSGARITKFWVINEEWSVEFTADILDDTFPSQAIKESLEFAGLYNGLLDGRPEFGRFRLESFEKIK